MLTSSRNWEHCSSWSCLFTAIYQCFLLPGPSLFVLDLLPLVLIFCWEHQCSQTIPTGDWGAQLFSRSVWDCCESHLNSFCAVAETYCQAATHLCSPCGSSYVLNPSWLSCFGACPALLSSLVLVKHCCFVMLSGPSAAVLGAHVPFQIAQADRKQKLSTFLLEEWMFAVVKVLARKM